VPLLGDNAFQMVDINEENVKQLRVTFARSGAVTEINFCSSSSGPTPVPPTKAPPTLVPPTKSPPTPAPVTVSGKAGGTFINAGGSDYTDPDGITWVADTGFYTTGKTHSTTADITNTGKPKIYQTERYGSEMRYDIDLLNGEYNVYLHFAEIYSKAFNEGARVFDVFVEGDLVAYNLDVFKEAGGEGNKAYVLLTADVVVSDGSLTIDFLAVKNKAKLSAIEIRAVSTSGSSAPSASPSESRSESPTGGDTYRRRANLREGGQWWNWGN